jgi:hypothetical protein
MTIAELHRASFQGRLLNLASGFSPWSTEVDPRIPQY